MSVRNLFAVCAALALAPALAIAQPAYNPVKLKEITGKVSAAELRADVEKLVSFGTRHTASDPDNPTRGIGAARRWAEGKFREYSAACGGCLTIALPAELVSVSVLSGGEPAPKRAPPFTPAPGILTPTEICAYDPLPPSALAKVAVASSDPLSVRFSEPATLVPAPLMTTSSIVNSASLPPPRAPEPRQHW